MEDSASWRVPRDAAPLGWFLLASALAHLILLLALPAWRRAQATPDSPLQVELRAQPPKVEPPVVAPKPLPVQAPPLPRERPQPAAAKSRPENVLPREAPPVEVPRAPILTAPAPSDAPADVAAAPAAPEPRPVPAAEPPRAPPAPAVVPAPVTPPRSDAAYLSNPKPLYPLAARRRGDQGTVLVRVMVTADGLAARASLEKSSGHPALDEAALSAVKSWRFVPAQQGGRAVEAPYTVPVVFKLD